MKLLDQYLKAIEKELDKKKDVPQSEERGTLLELKDGVAILSGLQSVFYGEIVDFNNGVQAFVIDLAEETTGAVILGDYENLKSGDSVKSTGKVLSVPVGEALLGRVVDSLAEPLDGLKKVKLSRRYPMEKIAPGVIYRRPVTVPIQTGLKVIDALIPIGRGQRELIIGDRSTGKTTLAVDTIINQKDENVICIYCAIGQKNSKTVEVIETLKRNNAMDYTIIVSASASSPAAMQYLAPYSATAIGEYFMGQGKDVLIIYDDLSKHSWAYRQMSLILRRPAGREAYPGDIFYLHSRLLERSCRVDPKYGGGSITALPIVETLEGDVSGYIPTNIISITDGQIFLETELFNSGIRPAVNLGISVSRVGGKAQTKAMQHVAGTLKLDLAQYRALAAFSQFESDLDEATKKTLNRGAKVTELLKQRKNQPYSLAEQVGLLWAATNGYIDDLELAQINKFEENFISNLKSSGKKLMIKINKHKTLEKADEKEIKKLIEES